MYRRKPGRLPDGGVWAKRFREFRKRVGINQAQLANLLGLSGHPAVSDIERGAHMPRRKTMQRFIAWESRSDKDVRHAKFNERTG